MSLDKYFAWGIGVHSIYQWEGLDGEIDSEGGGEEIGGMV